MLTLRTVTRTVRRKVIAIGSFAGALFGLSLGLLAATGNGSGEAAARAVGAACPNGAQTLPANALAGATRAALREAPAL